MSSMVQGMTLQEILINHHILAASELKRRVPGLSRTQAWNLWSGKAGVGKETMRTLHDRLGISYEELMEVDPVPARQKKAPEAARPKLGPKNRGAR
jgi:hypothetical protein